MLRFCILVSVVFFLSLTAALADGVSFAPRAIDRSGASTPGTFPPLVAARKPEGRFIISGATAQDPNAKIKACVSVSGESMLCPNVKTGAETLFMLKFTSDTDVLR